MALKHRAPILAFGLLNLAVASSVAASQPVGTKPPKPQVSEHRTRPAPLRSPAQSTSWPDCLEPVTTSATEISSQWTPARIQSVGNELARKGLQFGSPVFLRSFRSSTPAKEESDPSLELWMRGQSGSFVLFKKYSVCGKSVSKFPVGYYSFAPAQVTSVGPSRPSLRLNFPNAVESASGKYAPLKPVPAIEGGCDTSNALGLSEAEFDEVFVLVTSAVNQNQMGDAAGKMIPYAVPFESLPFPLSEANLKTAADAGASASNLKVWKNLAVGSNSFDEVAYPPVVTLKGQGKDAEFAIAQFGFKISPRKCP